MHHVHLDSLHWDEIHSPTKKFHSFYCNLSLALGAPRNVGLTGGGHPFDLQLRRIPAGAAVCPYHLHLAQWEFFVVRRGHGRVRTPDGFTDVKPGDAFFHPPGSPHQLFSTGPDELEVLIIADHPPLDGCYYPDSDKWFLRPPGKLFRITETDYFDGEDPAPAGAPPSPFAPPPPTLPIAPFAQRRVVIDAVPWEVWESPNKKFRSAYKGISEALGAKRDTPTGLGGHPFDLEVGRLDPGQCGCPYHSHSSQWELFLFHSGTATVRTPAGTRVFGPGDLVLHPPGEAHQFTNTGADELHYSLVADNPPTDIWHYPDSDKWGHSGTKKFFRATDVDYWDREE